ncbi:hypothetical protein EIKCOROL_02259 [Eikenella corrodens ATCC 23834]|uniref:Uncharacterized protein n=1 Tax=Eikenella corrodens ATCC 23834 TaxID=546274 RepID=C0DXZ7_EIKCO|nr:hypothetical protein EIKCOROL_02259 [Eikenella corrodens ATCC 23834]
MIRAEGIDPRIRTRLPETLAWSELSLRRLRHHPILLKLRFQVAS